MLEAGQPFPKFSLPNQDGKTVTLSDFTGKWLVVYVYPKDDTPGCTIEGKSFSASKSDFDKLNTVVLGISADDAHSHKTFCNKFSFTIDLLADVHGEVLGKAGVGQSDWKGVKYWNRVTFIIDPNGKVAKVYENVNPEGHDQAVLKDLQTLQKQPVA